MNKLLTFLRYAKDYLTFGQIALLISSLIYAFTGKTILKTQLVKSKAGLFLHRKGTLDFQFANYGYEWNVKKVVLKNMNDYDVFIDIGANIGSYTILLGNMGMQTFSFEPAYDNYKALNINILLNNLENKSTNYNVGVSNENTTAAFVFDPLNTGASHLETKPAENEKAEDRGILTEINLVRLDDMMEKMNISEDKKVCMKIDVEGMEAEVLQGAFNFIRKFAQVFIVMESIHSGEERLKSILNEIAIFEYLPVDNLNFAARKISNHKNL